MPALDRELQKYLEAMETDGVRQVPIGDVGMIVAEIVRTLGGDLTTEDVIRFNSDRAEAAVANARPSIAPDPVPPSAPRGAAELLQGPIFPEISRDLDSVAERLQHAAQRILASTEKVEGLMDNLEPKDATLLLDAITEIYSACGFEDITGQTIERVMSKLRQIEYQSERLLAAMGNAEARERAAALEKDVETESARQKEQLLHGPDSMKDANSQDEIDQILASFD